jgi:hypothetical protein
MEGSVKAIISNKKTTEIISYNHPFRSRRKTISVKYYKVSVMFPQHFSILFLFYILSFWSYIDDK